MTHIDVVTSRTNSTVRLVRSLYDRRSVRHREQLFVAEGERTIGSLIDHGCRLVRLLFDADRQDDVPANFFQAAEAADAHVLAVDPTVFGELSDVEAAQAVIGVFAFPSHTVPATPSAVVAFDGIQDPGNLGSIMRTCNAAAVDVVLFMKGTVDPYSPKVIRATAGQIAALNIIHLSSPAALAGEELCELPGRILIADGKRGTPHTEIDWSSPFVLVLGNEASGPNADWSEFESERVRIAMNPSVESLNVAAAAAVLLFEARRDYAFI